MQWWAVGYPGADPGGGGYVAQRMLSSKNERHSLLATRWFNIAHYTLRPWPWIIVGLVSVIRYPGLANPEEGYVKAMVDLLPSPLKGLMLAAFAAAYMSTIATHLNWGASYLVNDVCDAGRDRLHPVKRGRPVASGAVPDRAALTAAGSLPVLSLAMAPGLGARGNRVQNPTRQLSLVERMKCELAAALLHRPRLGLPLDEPRRAARRYASLSAEQVRAAFARWLRLGDLAQVTRGPAPH